MTWPEVTIPQSTIPVTIKGHKYVVEFDEYDSNVTAYSADENVGGVRIIDVADEKHPKVVSRMRLAVWERGARKKLAQEVGSGVGAWCAPRVICFCDRRKLRGVSTKPRGAMRLSRRGFAASITEAAKLKIGADSSPSRIASGPIPATLGMPSALGA